MLKQLLLAQLLCGALIISANAAPAAKIRSVMPEAEKYGLMPSRDFIGDMCRILNDSFQMVPWPIRSDGICDNLGLNIPDREAELCPMFDVAKMLLSFLQSSYPMQCSPDGIPAPSDRDPSGKGFLLPTPLPSQVGSSGLASRFPHDTSKTLLQTEGPSYYWLFKNVMRVMSWAPCGALGWDSTYQQPAGFELLKTISAGVDLSGYQIQATQMPFATVLRRPTTPENQAKCAEFVQDQARAMASLQRSPRRASMQAAASASKELCAGDELVILIRGTTSAADWQYNLDMGLTYNSNYGQGVMHKGFVRLSDSLWEDGLREALEQAGSSVSAVTISGHSLGAAAASLLASRAQMHFAAAGISTQVTAVLFGSPNVGDATFTADYNSRVNTRNVNFFADMVPQMPCVGSMVGCAQKISANGQASGNTTIQSLHYDRLGGSITLTGAHMPLQPEAWSALSAYTQDDFCDNMMSMGNHMEATHSCSYMCALSAGTEEEGNWCMLWDNTESWNAARLKGTGASFCMSGFNFISDQGDFPTFPMFPSIKDPAWLAKQVRRGPQNKTARAPPASGTTPPAGGEHEGHAHHHG